MLDLKIIQRSKSSWINPLVVVPKKDNTVRLCLDARYLNDQLQDDYDTPEGIDEIFRDCRNIGIMSTFDLNVFGKL